MVLWEAGLVGTAALLAGGAVTAFVGWLVRHAIAGEAPDMTMTVPWLPLLAIFGTCVGLALLAGVSGSRQVGRRD
jgi:putative ABC transport system permease protein